MGVLPLPFPQGQNAESLGLTGTETFTVTGVEALNAGTTPRAVTVSTDTGVEFDAVVRIDTPGEADYYGHAGILKSGLRKMLASCPKPPRSPPPPTARRGGVAFDTQ